MKTIKIYKDIAGSLSEPSKMPGWGYGLPALESCSVGSRLAKIEGTPCFDCYACKGRYLFPNVVKAQQKRLAAIHDPEWVDAMVALIGSKEEKCFRWHDSGDLTSLAHLSKICEIAVRLTDYNFWLPSLERLLIALYRKTYGPFPKNLVVRLSTPKIDGKPPATDLCTSSVYKTTPYGHVCPAKLQGNQCGPCRACWDPAVKHVSYPYH